MVTIQKINVLMFSEVYDLLLDFRNEHLTADDWKNIFEYQWDQEEDYCGYGLFDGEKLVGFLGLIFSKRPIGDRIELFCNLTSWIVKREYRKYSLFLLQPLLELKRYTITDLTPSRAAYSIERRMGFSELDSRMRVLLPMGHSRKGRRTLGICCSDDKSFLEKKLNDRDLKLFHDHRNYRCGHLIVSDKIKYCYIIYIRVKGYRILYCYIQHISNLNLFAKYNSLIRSYITRKGKTPFILVDSRLVQQIRLPFSFELPVRSLKVYKSNSLKPAQIDNLYSELVLLNLSPLPTPKRIGQDLLTALIGKDLRPYDH
jgi:hypothetical protein